MRTPLRFITGSLAILTLIQITACGDGNPSEDNNSGVYYPPEQKYSGAFGELLSEASLACEDPSECPENVGLVVIHDSDTRMYGQCSGTLVTPNTILTNSHCIPDSVKKNPAYCSTELGFISAKTHERAVCSRLLIASDISDEKKKNTDPDYALFQLDRPLKTQPANLTISGVSDKQELTAYATDPVSKSEVGGLIRKKSCLAIQGTIMAPAFVHPFGKVISLFGSDCNVIHGNSGSGLRNSQNQVVAVISHSLQKKDPMGSQPNQGGLAANLACLDLTSIDQASNSGCTEYLADPPKLKSGLDEEKLKALLIIALNNAPAAFKYKVTLGKEELNERTSESTIPITMTPVCVKPINTWSDKIPINKRRTGILKSERYFETSIEENSIVLKVELDQYFRPMIMPQLRMISTSQFDIALNKAETKFKGKRTFTVMGKSIDIPVSLSLCTPEQLRT